MNEVGFCFDLESDEFVFKSTKIWTIVLKDLVDNEKMLKINPFIDPQAKEKFIDWVASYEERPLVVGHNILGFDMFSTMCLMGLNFKVGKKNGDEIEGIPVQFVDTYYWSMYLLPDRIGHSIAAFGERLGLPKIDFRQASIDEGIIPADAPEGAEFKQHSPLMDVYCERDVDVNIKVFQSLLKEHKALYGLEAPIASQAFKCGQKSFFLMSCQEYTGWKFDLPFAIELAQMLEDDMEVIRAEVEPQLPPRNLKKAEEKDYTMPAKPFKQDGTYSANWHKWVAKHNGKKIEEGVYEFYGKKYEVVGKQLLDIKLPMEMANQDQMKDWFLEMGWSPTMYNFKKGPDGKAIRDPKTRQLILTSPKMQEAGKICPNLEAMEGEIVKQVVKWMSLRNRQGILRGWIEHERIEYDGRLPGRRSGIASTHRQKHAVICNVPKASEKVLYGKEFRSLFTIEKGMKIAAADASGIEARVQGHYSFKYDGGSTATELLDGDVHSKTAKSVYEDELKAFDITSPDFNKEDSIFKPYRDRSKNIFYAILYGAGDAKVASTAGLPESRGKEVSERFWAANEGTKKLKDALERYWDTVGKKKHLPAIDGRILHTRKKSALLNTIFQSCGGIIMDYACCFMDMWLGDIYFDCLRRPYYLYKGKVVRRVIYYHDEMSFECEEAVAEEVSQMIVKAIVKAGEFLKLKVPLAGEGKTGDNWKDVH